MCTVHILAHIWWLRGSGALNIVSCVSLEAEAYESAINDYSLCAPYDEYGIMPMVGWIKHDIVFGISHVECKT